MIQRFEKEKHEQLLWNCLYLKSILIKPKYNPDPPAMQIYKVYTAHRCLMKAAFNPVYWQPNINAAVEEQVYFVYWGGGLGIVLLKHSNYITYEPPENTWVLRTFDRVDRRASFLEKTWKPTKKQRVQIVLSVRLLYMHCMFLFTMFILSS